MSEDNTKPAWASRAVMVPIMGLVAFWLERYGIKLPLEVQGFAVDLMPMIVTAAMAGGIWFRVTARKLIDRWF